MNTESEIRNNRIRDPKGVGLDSHRVRARGKGTTNNRTLQEGQPTIRDGESRGIKGYRALQEQQELAEGDLQ